MTYPYSLWVTIGFVFFCTVLAQAQVDYKAPGDIQLSSRVHPAFKVESIHDTLGWQPKVGAIDVHNDGSVWVATWDSTGSIYKISSQNGLWLRNTTSKKCVASGLCEPLGMTHVGNRIFVAQRPEITEILDRNADGWYETYKTLYDDFGFTGNYHEFTFGLLYRNGRLYGSLSTPRRTRVPSALDRGTVFRYDLHSNTFTYLASGFRTPNGLGFLADSQIVICDNQGEWVPVSKVVVLDSGKFYGYRDVDLRGTYGLDVSPAAVWLPHFEVGNSPSQPLLYPYAPFKNQLIIGDVTHGGIKRIFLEKINGQYQGGVVNFTQGLSGGINRMAWAPDGALWVGAIGSAGNWGQDKPKLRYGLQRLVQTGKRSMDIHSVKIKKNGFEMQFTDTLHPMYSVADLTEALRVESWQYQATEHYGGPKLNQRLQKLSLVIDPKDRTKIYIRTLLSVPASVFYFKWGKPLVSVHGDTLWNSETWYTAQSFPIDDSLNINSPKETKIEVNNTAKPKSTTSQRVQVKNPTTKTVKTVSVKASTQVKLDGKVLIQSHGCTVCHSANETIVGPSFAMIYERYRKQSNIESYLVKKVINGGRGVWGDEAMAPHAHVPQADIEAMIKYILSGDY